MTHISFRRLAFSCAAVFLAGAMTPAFAEDRELQEATGFTGTIMYLSAKVPGLIFGAVRNGETALIWAAAENHGDAIRALVAGGANPDQQAKPLDLAPMDWVQIGMVSTILPVGGWSPLMYAARENAPDAARALAEVGANLDLRDQDGTTALGFAIMNRHYDLAALLLEAGDPPSATLMAVDRPPVPQLGDPSLVLLRRVGRVDPASLPAYRAAGGYEALRLALDLGADHVLREHSYARRLDTVRAALAGRGLA